MEFLFEELKLEGVFSTLKFLHVIFEEIFKYKPYLYDFLFWPSKILISLLSHFIDLFLICPDIARIRYLYNRLCIN